MKPINHTFYAKDQSLTTDKPQTHPVSEYGYKAIGWFLTLVAILHPTLISGQESWYIREQDFQQDPWSVQMAVNNDFMTNNSVNDDFYTFGMRLEARNGKASYRLEENAFTDRLDGQRFDETFFTLGGLIADGTLNGWNIWFEGGVAHIGEGLLGQGAQNSLHSIIGDDSVFLEYISIDRYRAHISTEIGQQWQLNDVWSIGPQFGLSWTDDMRWNSVIGIRTQWCPQKKWSADIIVGARYSRTDIYLLEPHLKKQSLAAKVNLNTPSGIFIEWSLNRYGTERQHLAFGYRLGPSSKSETFSSWDLAYSTP